MLRPVEALGFLGVSFFGIVGAFCPSKDGVGDRTIKVDDC
jgi:hypothetical protein